MNNTPIEKLTDNSFLITLKKKIYSKRAILETSYKLTKDYNILIDEDDLTYKVHFNIKNNDLLEVNDIAQLFNNELLDQQLRMELEEEMRPIREKIISIAFNSTNMDS